MSASYRNRDHVQLTSDEPPSPAAEQWGRPTAFTLNCCNGQQKYDCCHVILFVIVVLLVILFVTLIIFKTKDTISKEPLTCYVCESSLNIEGRTPEYPPEAGCWAHPVNTRECAQGEICGLTYREFIDTNSSKLVTRFCAKNDRKYDNNCDVRTNNMHNNVSIVCRCATDKCISARYHR